MIRIAFVALWLALSASFLVSASIIGMPTTSIVIEIVRVTLVLLLVVVAISLMRIGFQEWRLGGARLHGLIQRFNNGNVSSV